MLTDGNGSSLFAACSAQAAHSCLPAFGWCDFIIHLPSLQVCAERQGIADQLSQLHASHKQLQQQKEELDTELGTLKPAHAELKQMHHKASSELQGTKDALQKSQEARVRAEVRGIIKTKAVGLQPCSSAWLNSDSSGTY